MHACVCMYNYTIVRIHACLHVCMCACNVFVGEGGCICVCVYVYMKSRAIPPPLPLNFRLNESPMFHSHINKLYIHDNNSIVVSEVIL